MFSTSCYSKTANKKGRIEWKNRRKKWSTNRRKKRTKIKRFFKKDVPMKMDATRKKRCYQRHCLRKWLPRHRNAYDKIFIVQMCTINDVSVTIPERCFNAFFMQYIYIYTPCVETFIFNQCYFDLFAFEVQWLLRFSIYHVAHSLEADVFLSAKLWIKKKHTHTRYHILREICYISITIVSRHYIDVTFASHISLSILGFFFLQKRTNEPTSLSDTVNVRERKQRTMWTWTSDTKSMTSLLNVTRYITYNIHSYELFMGKVIQSILLHLFVLWITCHLLLIFQLDLWTDPHKFSVHIHLTYADCIQ